MDDRDLNKAFEGIARLAVVGMCLSAIFTFAAFAGVVAVVVWAWNHLSVGIH